MRSSIRFHQWLLVAAVLVPALLFGLFAWQSRRETYREANETVDRTAVILVEHARKVFDTVDLILDRLSFQLRVAGSPGRTFGELNGDLHDIAARYNQIVSVWVADAAGQIIAGSQPWEPGGSIAPRDFFVAHQKGDVGTYVSPAFVGRATTAASFAVSRRRNGDNGGFAGTIHVALNPAYFQEFFAEAAPRLPGAASLIRADGEVLARHPGIDRRRLPPGNMLMRALAANPEAGHVIGPSSRDGAERMIAYRKISALPVYSTFAVDKSDIDQQWLRSLPGVAAGSAIAALILLLTAWTALQRAKTEQKALAQLRSEIEHRLLTEERLRRSQRLEAVGQLTGGVAHDFNNLLMVVLGNAERLLHGTLEPKQQRSVQAIVTAAKSGESLNRQLLAFAGRQSLTPEVVDLRAALSGMEEMISTSLRGRVGFEIDIDPATWRVKVDLSELRLAILNLVVNARDAMPDGGTVRIATANRVVEAAHPVDGRHGAFAVISISDTGHGMPPEVLARVFEPFFTTKSVGQGTGLGLSQVHGFTHQSDGAVAVESAAGKGTTIRLHLPRTLEPLAGAAEPTAQAATQSGHVLLVEDNVAVSDVTRGYLEKLGFDVTEARDADSALDHLRNGLKPSLVMSDIVMPGSMSGADMARIIKTEHPGIPILLMTGYNRNRDNLADDGFVLLIKPFAAEDVELAIRRVAGRLLV